MPELKQILGAMVFGANSPLSVKEMLKSLKGVAEEKGGETQCFLNVRDADVIAALDELRKECEKMHNGFFLVELAGGFKFQTDPSCGVWLRRLLDVGKPSRLSSPALETLAIIAYRQPIVRSEIESVRGVAVDHIVRGLMEMKLIKITGRSELPGRPFMYGTTSVFLNHFGLKHLEELKAMEPMLLHKRSSEKKEISALKNRNAVLQDVVGGNFEGKKESMGAKERDLFDES